MGSDAFPGGYERPAGCAVLIGLTDIERARDIFRALADGGRATMPFEKTFWSPGFGVLIDRFGGSWEVNAQNT